MNPKATSFWGDEETIEMNLRNALLGTNAVIGAVALAVPSTASAFEVNIRGFHNFSAVTGDLEESGNAGNDPKDYDFLTDSEIHVQASQTDDETGIRYGMLVEFEADGNSTLNTDESWIFVDGAFGGFRLGDEDGAVDNSKIGAYNIAAGTGGIDGQGVVASAQFAPTNSGDSTKIRYDSPSIAGFTTWPFGGETIYSMAKPDAGFEVRRTEGYRDAGSMNTTSILSDAKFPAISPAGDQLAYICNGTSAICVLNLDSGESIEIYTLNYVRIDNVAMPATVMWSADGLWLYFASADGGDWDIFRMRPDGSEVQNLTPDWNSNELMPALRW